MSIASTEYRTAKESLEEALRVLNRINPDNLNREDLGKIRTVTSQALQGAKSCAVLQGMIDYKFTRG